MFENRSQISETEVNAPTERSQNSSYEQTCFMLTKTVESQYSSSSRKNQLNGTCSGRIGNFLNIPSLKIKLDKKTAFCNSRTNLESHSFFVFEVTFWVGCVKADYPDYRVEVVEGRQNWLDTNFTAPTPPPFSLSEHRNI